MRFDYLIVGSGFAGSVLAERLASQLNKRVLVIERRNHIGGNSYDYYNNDGILVHKYGPHYFRTNNKAVFDYLSQFTEWHNVYYRIKVVVDGKLVTLPVNLDTVNELYGYGFSSDELKLFFDSKKTEIKEIKNSEDAIISKIGRELYEKIYKEYTVKQWGIEPKELDPSVCGRIPVRINRDDRYFTDKYQAMPKYGYHKMFQKMLEHPNIQIMLQADFKEIKDRIDYDNLIYTGPIDSYFDYKFGKLPYRSLRFEHETIDKEYYQPVSQVNYPHDYDFTRIVEIKHATGQQHNKTTIVREYPAAEGEPYYPVPMPRNEDMYRQYKAEAEMLDNICFVGRLAEYKYYNMDQVVARAFEVFEDIKAKQCACL